MKKVVIGDIHGKSIWRDIIRKENPDFVIFLGDYVDTHHEETVENQIYNLGEILKYKEENNDKVILLRGNHCYQYAFRICECSTYNCKTQTLFPRDKYKELTQWIYIDNNIIFSHAGISEVWMKNIPIDSINDLDVDYFRFNDPYDTYGESVTQSPIWIRPASLYKCALKGYIQVVGHTATSKGLIEIKSINGDSIYLCDALDNNQYLVIEDNEFIIKQLNYGSRSN